MAASYPTSSYTANGYNQPCTTGAILIYGHPDGCGFWTDTHVHAGGLNDVLSSGLPASVNNGATLISYFQGLLTTGSLQDHTGAEMMVLTMLGCNPGQANCTFGGVNMGTASRGSVSPVAGNKFWTQWTAAINAAVIDQNVPRRLDCNLKNSLWDPFIGASGDDAFYETGDRAQNATGNPAYSINCNLSAATSYSYPAFIIYAPTDLGKTTPLYIIKRNCGNPIGTLGPIKPAVGFTNTPGGTSTPSTLSAGTTTTVTFKPQVVVSTTGSDPFNYDGGIPHNSAAGDPAITCVAPCSAYTNSYTATSSGTYGAPQVHWYTFTITVPANYPNGHKICSTFSVTPHSNTDSLAASFDICLTVSNSKSPAFYVKAGDAHAGCGAAQPIVTAAGSSVTEVASASGTISGLASGVALQNYVSNTTFTLCVPDLWAVQMATIGTTARTTSHGTLTGAVDVTGLSGVWNVNTPATISGTVNNNLTLIVNGPVSIGQINNSGNSANSIANLPSFGVISNSDITFIPSAAGATDHGDGFYWTQGSIYTCDGLLLLPDAKCNSQLNVNGFLMAKQGIYLTRYGIAGGGNPIGEQITLGGVLYLNPPTFFDEQSLQNGLAGSNGETTPLY
jgi:hypothetical protein